MYFVLFIGVGVKLLFINLVVFIKVKVGGVCFLNIFFREILYEDVFKGCFVFWKGGFFSG